MKSRWRSPSTISLKARVSTPTSSRERTGKRLREIAVGHAARRAPVSALIGPGQPAREEQAQEQRAQRPGRRALQIGDVELAQAVEEDVDLVVHAEHRDRAALRVDDRRDGADPGAARRAVGAGVACHAVLEAPASIGSISSGASAYESPGGSASVAGRRRLAARRPARSKSTSVRIGVVSSTSRCTARQRVRMPPVGGRSARRAALRSPRAGRDRRGARRPARCSEAGCRPRPPARASAARGPATPTIATLRKVSSANASARRTARRRHAGSAGRGRRRGRPFVSGRRFRAAPDRARDRPTTGRRHA